MASAPHRRTAVPWQIPASDLVAQRPPEYTRDVQGERQLALIVYCGCEARVTGLLALRCARKGSDVSVLTACIPDDYVLPAMKPAIDVTLLSGPRRHDDDGA
jgi:hypothetical protein